MEYRKLPGTELEMPMLTLGVGTFGGSHGFEGWALSAEQVACLDAVSRKVKTYPYRHQGIKPKMKSQIF